MSKEIPGGQKVNVNSLHSFIFAAGTMFSLTDGATGKTSEGRRNLVLDSPRLVFWLFFHPSAWRGYLATAHPDLDPDFCLAELGRRQWLNYAFWRLLIMVYLGWSLLVALLIGLCLRLFGESIEAGVVGVLVGVGVGVLTSLATSIVGSLAVGAAVGIAAGIVTGLASGLYFGTAGELGTFFAEQPANLIVSVAIGLASGLAGGLSYGVAVGVAKGENVLGSSAALSRQLSGIVIGIVIGGIAGLLAGAVRGQLLTGAAIGVPFALAVGWRTQKWRRGIFGGLAVGLIGSLLLGRAELGVTGAGVQFVGLGALMASMFGLPYVMGERISGPGSGALAGTLGGGAGLFLFVAPPEYAGPLSAFILIGILLGLTVAWWRPIFSYPFILAWNNILYRIDQHRIKGTKPSVLRWHSAFWDELQRLPLLGLDNHLLLLMMHWPKQGARAIEQLSFGPQRWAAQATQIELDALQLEQCADVAQIAAAHEGLSAGNLAGPASALLRSFSRISRDVEAANRQGSAYNQRLALDAVEDRLDGLVRELTRSNEKYASRFQPIAAAWREIVATHVKSLVDEAELRQELDSPYIIGVPLTERQEIFVGRSEISARIEQLLLDRRQPALLLYGQRRVGKTSLLNNLGRLLPSSIVPLFVDLQGPATRAKDDVGFLYNVARSIARSSRLQRGIELPVLAREQLAIDPYSQFEEWLDAIEKLLEKSMALLMFDEFEVLDQALLKGRFDQDSILGMVRHLIQHRPRFKVLLSGSHTLNEFQRWSSYLINVQVVRIGYLSDDEARRLIEFPVKSFALQYDEDACRHVLALTQGHPFLVQLLCAEIVALKNEQAPEIRRRARWEDVEAAVLPALDHGSFFFADIEQNQVDDCGRALLHLIAVRKTETKGFEMSELSASHSQTRETVNATITDLLQKEIIRPVNGGYQFQVELVRRWFAERLKPGARAHSLT